MKSSAVSVEELDPRPRRLVLLFVVALILYSFTLICGTHIPEEYFPFQLPPEELLHFAGYGVLTILLLGMLGAMGWRPNSKGISFWASIVLLVGLIAMTDELTQPLFGRSFTWKDWFADLTGACCSVVLVNCVLWMGKARVRD